MGDVRLVDLDVFKRYSLAIRQESAPVEEVLAVLEATRRQVQAAAGAQGRTPSSRGPAPPPAEAEAAWRPEDGSPEPHAAPDAGPEPGRGGGRPRRVRRRARPGAADGP